MWPAAVQAPAATPPDASGRKENIRQALVEFFERDARKPASLTPTIPPPAHRPGREPPFVEREVVAPAPPPASAGLAKPVEAERLREPDIAPAPPPSRVFCQLHDAYIIEEVSGGFVVIDQHALHERILYEELKERVVRASVPRQRLLMPELVDLPPADYVRVMEMKDSLLRMGVEVEPFGEKTVAVHAVPHVADAVNPRELLLEIVNQARAGLSARPGEREERLLRVIACKAAIKAGRRLTRAQMATLLEQRDRVGPEPVCPHGRPTTLKFDLRELERQFRRR